MAQPSIAAPLAVHEALTNVARVHTETGAQGTGVLVDIGGRQHLITTAHGLVPGEVVQTLHIFTAAGDAPWVEARRVDESPAEDDLAILRLTTEVATGGSAPPPFDESGLLLGQPCLLVGYTVAIEHSISIAGRPPSPFPVVKSGVIAAKPPGTTWLDLTANSGFSGGPVVARRLNDCAIVFLGIVKGTGVLTTAEQVVQVAGISPVLPAARINEAVRQLA